MEDFQAFFVRNSRPAFEKLNTLAMPAATGEEYFQCAGIALASGYAYFGTNQVSAKAVKIDVSGVPSRIGQMVGTANEDDFLSCAIATDNVCGYFVTNTSPAIVVKVNLVTMARIESLALGGGENLGMVALDQIEELDEAVVDAALGRLRRKNSARQLLGAANPLGRNWVWKQ